MAYAYDFNRVPGPSADEIKANQGEGALCYGTGQQQDAGYIADLERQGLHVPLIWEHNTDSILGGYPYGVSECQAWEASHSPGLVYLACDLNDGALGGRSIVPFCNGWCDTTRETTVGLYGPDHAILDGIAMTRPKLSRWWGVVNWLDNGGPDNAQKNIDRWTAIGAHLIQLIGSPIADTDQNLILKPDWWTTDSPKPVPPALHGGADMDLYVGQLDKPGAIGSIPVPANTPVALLVSSSGRIISTWAGPGPLGVPQGAADWASARPRVNVIALDKPQMAEIIVADAHTRT